MTKEIEKINPVSGVDVYLHNLVIVFFKFTIEFSKFTIKKENNKKVFFLKSIKNVFTFLLVTLLNTTY